MVKKKYPLQPLRFNTVRYPIRSDLELIGFRIESLLACRIPIRSDPIPPIRGIGHRMVRLPAQSRLIEALHFNTVVGDVVRVHDVFAIEQFPPAIWLHCQSFTDCLQRYWALSQLLLLSKNTIKRLEMYRQK